MLVGAEAVVENGGVINKLGTYQIAMAAKAHSVPVYVAAESYKFARWVPTCANYDVLLLPSKTAASKLGLLLIVGAGLGEGGFAAALSMYVWLPLKALSANWACVRLFC